jgi:hypothetical protein
VSVSLPDVPVKVAMGLSPIGGMDCPAEMLALDGCAKLINVAKIVTWQRSCQEVYLFLLNDFFARQACARWHCAGPPMLGLDRLGLA